MKSNILIEIGLDKDKNPESIEWTAEGADGEQKRPSKAMLLSFFDKESLETLKIDLWTKDMQVAEMDRLMYNTLKALADSYFNATKNEALSNQFKSFAHHFGVTTKIIQGEDI